MKDPENNIYRPRQNYTGYPKREFLDLAARKEGKFETSSVNSKKSIRRDAAKSVEKWYIHKDNLCLWRWYKGHHFFLPFLTHST